MGLWDLMHLLAPYAHDNLSSMRRSDERALLQSGCSEAQLAVICVLSAGAVRGAGGGYFVSMLVLAAASLAVSLLSAAFQEPKKLKRRLSGEMQPSC